MTGSGEKTTKGNGTETPVKPTPQLWRDRLSNLPRQNKWILAAIATLLALLILLVSIAALRANKAIDIGTLIVNGKYINTITSCGHIQG